MQKIKEIEDEASSCLLLLQHWFGQATSSADCSALADGKDPKKQGHFRASGHAQGAHWVVGVYCQQCHLMWGHKSLHWAVGAYCCQHR